MVSQHALNVGEVSKSFKCWRKTFDKSEAARILVSSIEFGSCGEIFSIERILFNNYNVFTHLKVLWEVGIKLCGNKLPIECHREPADLELRGRLIGNWKHACEFHGEYHSTFVRFPKEEDIQSRKIFKNYEPLTVGTNQPPTMFLCRWNPHSNI